ncbi:MAG: nicotinate-nucleotide--dimethylbenzimidazole phosphoribosyltransferase [Alphaproteobacteria bacterium]|nr:nicotinate-nucleotide--dimethylbenzimidazole phosphoribosyltransferase [Alphaproteobacteria bacterium]
MSSLSAPPLPELEEIYALIGSQTPFCSGKQVKTAPEWLIQIWQSSQGDKGEIIHPRLSLFVSHHGLANTHSQTEVDSYVHQCASGSARLNHMVEIGNTDFRLYEMDTSHPSGNPLKGEEALPANDLVRAMAYGMMAVEPEIDLLAASGFGAGSAESAEAICSAHTGNRNSVENLTIAGLIKANHDQKGLNALGAIGGKEIAALCGVILATHMARIPVLLEGMSGLAALLIMAHENESLAAHCALCGVPSDKLANLPIPLPVILQTDFPLPEETGIESAYHISGLRNELVLLHGQGRKLAS